MTEMISFGAGQNSVAMIILKVQEGWHGPIVFSDPGGEHPETYCYMDYFERDFLKPNGMELTRISPVFHPHLFDTQRRPGVATTLEDYCLMQGIIPLLAVRWCSVMFKGEPLEAWRKEHGIDVSLQGMTIDEPNRIRYNDPTVRYPLDEHGINRPECRRIIQRARLEVPRKSGCFFCPGQRLSQWRDLYLNYPDLFLRAVELERNAAKRRDRNVTLDPGGISLEQRIANRFQGQEQMDLSEWLPCACRL